MDYKFMYSLWNCECDVYEGIILVVNWIYLEKLQNFG